MYLPRLAIRNSQFVMVAFIILTIAGISSFLKMPRTENPEFTIPGATVILIYPGTNPVDMEQLVVGPIEDAINELEDIKKIETNINDGLAVLNVEFEFGSDPDKKYDNVVQQINSARSQLPSDIYDIQTLKWSPSDVVLLQLALVSENAEYQVLRDKAEVLGNKIKKIRNIKKTEIFACPQREVRVSLDMEKMALLGISLDQVEKAIRSNNANIPGGSINIGDRNLGIKTSGSYNNLSEIRNTIVHSYEGKLVYLKNIAQVYFDYEDPKYLARYNGKRAVFFTASQKEGKNVFRTREEIQPILDEFQDKLEGDISVHYVFDQSVEVADNVNGFLKNLLQGIMLVGIIILLSLGMKSALLVIIAIPLSIVIGLAFVDGMGFGLQQMTIAGLVVALGLLVDNSIVMTENINRFLDMGYKPRKAAIKAASEIGWPIVSATVTTILAFVPIAMMPDKTGQFIRGLPATIISTLTISLLIAIVLTPLLASKFFKGIQKKNLKEEKKAESRTRLDKYLRRLITGPYRRTLQWAIHHKGITLFIAIAALGISLYVFRFVGVSFFPAAEKPQFRIIVSLPEGTKLEKTDEVINYLEHTLDTMQGVRFYASSIGHGNPRIYYNVWPKNFTKNYGEIFVQLDSYDYEEFNELIVRLRKKYANIPGAQVSVKEFEQGHPVVAPIMIYATGDNLEELKKLGNEIADKLEGQPGAINIQNKLAEKRTDMYFRINKEKAGILGVPIFEIDHTIRTAISGMPLLNSTFRDEEGEEYDIVMRLKEGEGIAPSDFSKIYVPSLSGKQVPLLQLASVEFKKAPGMIPRYNLQRTSLVTAEIDKGYTIDGIMEPVLTYLDSYSFPEGYGYHIGGELENRSESFGGMQIAVIIALISIFAVLVLQFRSLIQPLVIFSAIPLAIIGSVWALWITGYSFSFTAFIGFTSLIGIVINNSIILVDFTNQLRERGESLSDAIQHAGEIRFIPILLTTLTTIGGLLPLTLEGGTMWAPLGWTIIGGLVVSTFLTLIVVPVLYKVFTKEGVPGLPEKNDHMKQQMR